jgi:hypothetical protein
VQWHDLLWTFRQVLFLALPLLAHLLPGRAPSSPAPALARLPALAHALDAALGRAHLLKLASAAAARDPRLAASAGEDEVLRRVAAQEGLAYSGGEGPLGMRAREVVGVLRGGFAAPAPPVGIVPTQTGT